MLGELQFYSGILLTLGNAIDMAIDYRLSDLFLSSPKSSLIIHLLTPKAVAC